MAVFIELTTEAFADVFKTRASSAQGGEDGLRSSRAGATSVRRPLRGIEIKEDTYAMVKIIRADGREIPLIDSSAGDGLSHGGYSNFILQSVQEARAEKSQIVQTFGDNYIFFFGEDPRFLDCQAILVNTHDFNWRAEWWANYNAYMRGSKLAELGARLYLFYDDIIVEGYLMNCAASETAMAPYSVQIQFRLFVTNYQNISFVGDTNFPIRSSVVVPDGVVLTRGDAGADITAILRGESLNEAQALNASRETQGAVDSGAASTEGDGVSTNVGPFVASAQAGGGSASASFGLPPGPQPATSQNPLASGSRITKILQSVPISFAVSQDWWDFIEGGQSTYSEAFNLKKLIQRSHNPLRGKISDNYDEYTGAPDNSYADLLAQFGIEGGGDRPATAIAGTIKNQLEADDLFREAIQFLACFGADIDDPGILISLGLGPNFKPQINVSDGATFNPTGEPTPLDDFLSNVGDKVESTTNGISDSFDAFAQDPLGSVFGKSKGQQFGSNKGKYTEGAGDPLYGYPSDFASGPGFGQAGFGDLGGAGFGTALGENGDPGFKDPNKFTYAGVANNQGAFDRFTAPKQDNTALSVTAGASLSLGTSGLSGGAGVAVNGEPSAFAVVSVPGLLDETGQARQQAEAIAAKQAQQKFGFSIDNPFGVNCPKQEGGVSEGLSYSWP